MLKVLKHSVTGEPLSRGEPMKKFWEFGEIGRRVSFRH